METVNSKKIFSSVIFFLVFCVGVFGARQDIFCGPAQAAGETGGSGKDFYLKLLPIHKVKKAPGPYDWLASHPESGQTFEEYIQGRPVVPTPEKRTIYLTLLGDFDDVQKKIIDKTAEFISVYFQLPVKFTKPVSLEMIPPAARRVHPQTKDPQILTTYVIEKILIPWVPEDAFCLIAFTPSDLWPGEGWNFVFGQASLDDRVGIWSIYRNGDPHKNKAEFQLCLKRTIKTGTHEIGHMFSITHDIYFESNMNGSNHRKESDERPLWLSPVDLRKLCWALKADPYKRYKQLHKICVKFGFNEEAGFYKKSMALTAQEDG